VGVWVCGCVGVWVCGCVGVWVCGCVGVWVWEYVRFCTRRREKWLWAGEANREVGGLLATVSVCSVYSVVNIF
jgi:hypothetical protein